MKLRENADASVSTKLKEVEELIDDLYALRHESLKSEGEYGLGNLVFKELRGAGYLDKLKEMKKDLEGKELSLFAEDEVLTEETSTKGSEIVKNPHLLEYDIIAMQDSDPERYWYDEAEDPAEWDWIRFNNLHRDLIDRVIKNYKLPKAKAQEVVNAYLGTEEEMKQAK